MIRMIHRALANVIMQICVRVAIYTYIIFVVLRDFRKFLFVQDSY